jgi:hypothetical protein
VGQAEARGRCRERGVGEVRDAQAWQDSRPLSSSVQVRRDSHVLQRWVQRGSVLPCLRRPIRSVQSDAVTTIAFISTQTATIPTSPAWRWPERFRPIHPANRWSNISRVCRALRYSADFQHDVPGSA